jgi:hypothetical protein
VASWIRCDKCRKVLSSEAFDPGSAVCRACLTGPVAKPRVARASAVKTVRAAAPIAAAPERAPLLGVAGSGDLEVREKRARRTALDALAQAHAEEFEQLLAAARKAEGLRA